MAKGFYAQGMVVLFDQTPQISELRQLLEDFQVVKEVEASDSWEISGPSLLLAYRPELNGYLSVDVVDQPWPDDMGDPQESPMLFSAWSMGHFGPFTFPGNLSSAMQQSWHWEEAGEEAQRHKAFVRLRLSYIFGADDKAPVIPEGSDPEQELQYISEIALEVLKHPRAICLFNPSGEILMNGQELQDSLDFAFEQEMPALNVWSNVRMFNLDERWLLMDCIGNEQFDVKDIEVPFLRSDNEPGEIATFIRNISLYLLRSQAEMVDRDTLDGPDGKTWRVKLVEKGLSGPPREVIRILPEAEYEKFGE